MLLDLWSSVEKAYIAKYIYICSLSVTCMKSLTVELQDRWLRDLVVRPAAALTSRDNDGPG